MRGYGTIRMRRSGGEQAASLGRLVVLTAIMLVAVASCSALGDSPEERAETNVIATEIQEALAQRADVVWVEVGYQNNISNSSSAAVNARVKAGTEFDPFIDEAVRLVWQSRLHPLSSIRVSVSDADDVQRGTTRHVAPADEDKAELERKYGARPPE